MGSPTNAKEFREVMDRVFEMMSTDPDMGLGEVLLRSGELNLQQYNHAMEKLVVSRRIGALLCELGYLQPDELIRGIERQANAIVLAVMSYRTGSYTIEFTNEFSDEILSLPLNTERLMLDGVKRIDYWSLITRGLGRFERLLEQVPGAEMRALALELDDEESHILSLLSEATTIQTVCERSYLPNFNTCRTLWGLLAVNLVQDAESGSMEEKRAAVETDRGIAGNWRCARARYFGGPRSKTATGPIDAAQCRTGDCDV